MRETPVAVFRQIMIRCLNRYGDKKKPPGGRMGMDAMNPASIFNMVTIPVGAENILLTQCIG